MKHTDFHMMYKAIMNKEVVELRNALQKFPLHQYDWDEHNEHRPRITASRSTMTLQVIMMCARLQKTLGMIVAFS